MRRFGLLGKTLKHSFSGSYFSEKFRLASIDAIYENFELDDIAQLPRLLENNPGIEGLNVTIPYKEAVLPFLHWKNEIVEATGASNCIRIVNGRLLGYNTDVPGFVASIRTRLQSWHTHALVLGSGGAAKAVRYALQQLGIHVLIVSRSGTDLRYEDVDALLMGHYKLVVNTTPLGMYPDVTSFPPIPFHLLTPSHFLFDLTYNPEMTLFLQKGADAGAQVQNGYDMLVEQAEASWEIWNR